MGGMLSLARRLFMRSGFGPLLLALWFFGFAEMARAQVTHTISNGDIWVGIDANAGASIKKLDFRVGSLISTSNVNNADRTGRQIQASLYDAESQSPDCWPVQGGCSANPSCPWMWNPVQAGDACQQGSPTSVLYLSGTRIITRTYPRQWNPFWGPSNVILDQDLEILGPHLVRVSYTVANNESFTINGSHELPVAYLSSSYQYAVHYGGGAPWTYDSVTTRSFGPGSKANGTTATEEWIGYTKWPGAAMLLYVPGMQSGWNTGRMEDGATLLQAWQDVTIQPGETRSVTAYLAVGSLSDARSAVYDLHGYNQPPSSMQQDSAVRSCANYLEWGATYKPSAADCYAHCQANGANACEWEQSGGGCYVEFGQGCQVQAGFSGWWAAVLSSPPQQSMAQDSAVRSCANYLEWGPTYKASAADCYAHCQANGANACEWEQSGGGCYVEFGQGCQVQARFSGWWAAVLDSPTAPSSSLVAGSGGNRLGPWDGVRFDVRQGQEEPFGLSSLRLGGLRLRATGDLCLGAKPGM